MRWMGKFLNAYESMAWLNSVARPWPQYCFLNIQAMSAWSWLLVSTGSMPHRPMN